MLFRLSAGNGASGGGRRRGRVAVRELLERLLRAGASAAAALAARPRLVLGRPLERLRRRQPALRPQNHPGRSNAAPRPAAGTQPPNQSKLGPSS